MNEQGWGGGDMFSKVKGNGRTESRQRMKPSETIWPASVAMMDELCPEARSASANNIAAAERSRAVRTNP